MRAARRVLRTVAVRPVVQTRRFASGSGDVTYRPLCPHLGAEVLGLPKSGTWSAEAVSGVRAALVKHSLLLIRDVHFDEKQLVDFSRHIGQLEFPPASEIARREASGDKKAKEIWVISNVKDPVTAEPVGALGYGEAEWHTDMSYIPVPPMASVLYAREVPPPSAGGNTSFASMFSALDGLPKDLRARIEGKKAKHDATYTSTGELRKGFAVESDVRKTPGAVHPIVRTHPDSGRKALFLGRRTNGYVMGLPVGESEQLLDALWAEATRPEYVYTHQWRVGDLLLWDNRSAIHKREAFDGSYRRYMLRTQIAGDAPV